LGENACSGSTNDINMKKMMMKNMKKMKENDR